MIDQTVFPDKGFSPQESTDDIEVYRALYMAYPDVLFRLDANGFFKSFKAVSNGDLAVPPIKFIGARLADVLPETVSTVGMKHIELALRTGEMQRYNYFLDIPLGSGDTRYFEVRMVPCGQDEVLAVTRDMTDLWKSRQALVESEAKYKSIMSLSADSVFLLDIKTGRILESNATFRAMLGYTDDELHALTITDFVAHPPEDIKEKIDMVLKTGRSFIGERLNRRKDGSLIDVEVSAHILSSHGRTVMCIVSRDITNRKKMVKELERYKYMVEAANDAIFTKDLQSRYRLFNRKTVEWSGLTADQIRGRSDAELMRDAETARVNIECDNFVLTTGQSLMKTRQMVDNEGKSHWMQTSKTPEFDDNGNITGLIGIARDITDEVIAQEKLRQQEEQYRLLVENSPEGIVVIQDGKLRFFNSRLLRLLGYEFHEMIDHSFLEFVSEDQIEIAGERYQRFLDGIIEDEAFETVLRHKNGSRVDVEVNVAAISYAGERAALLFTHDIRERVRAEQGLRTSLREKEVLLQEIHHRVKNNLQIVSSLLHLQARRLSDPEAQERFLECQTRIQAMALIHSKLYQQEALQVIQFGEYVTDLINYLREIYPISKSRLNFVLDVERMDLDLNTSISCGLILTELVTNAIKHAFNQRTAGTVTIALKTADDGGFTISVADDGCGVPPSLNLEDVSTLGLSLVISLVDQIDGTLRLERKNGTRFIVSFIPMTPEGVEK